MSLLTEIDRAPLARAGSTTDEHTIKERDVDQLYRQEKTGELMARYSHYNKLTPLEVRNIASAMLYRAGCSIGFVGQPNGTTNVMLTTETGTQLLIDTLIAYPTTYGEIEHLIRIPIIKAYKEVGIKVAMLRPAQVGESAWLQNSLSTRGWAMLMHGPRTGKTITALLGVVRDINLRRSTATSILPVTVLITTKRVAVKSWKKDIAFLKSIGLIPAGITFLIDTPFVVYKRAEAHIDYFIVDESHNIFGAANNKMIGDKEYSKILASMDMIAYRNQSARWVFLTATPHSQTVNQLYFQTRYSYYCNLEWKKRGVTNIRAYWDIVGDIQMVITLAGVAVPTFESVRDGGYEIIGDVVADGIRVLSQTDIGISEKLQPTAKVHLLPLHPAVKEIYSKQENGYDYIVGGKLIQTHSANEVKVRMHELESGTLKYMDKSVCYDIDGVRIEGVKPKEFLFALHTGYIDYIKEVWGDTEDMVIMYHYKAEGLLLKQHFEHATILQGTRFSEGYDLYMYKHMIIFSFDYKVFTNIQRQDRQVSLEHRKDPIEVHYLLTKGGISEEMYSTVFIKGEDYTMEGYRR